MPKSPDRRYGDPKIRKPIMITPEGWDKLKDLADQQGLSRSELIEQFARGLLSPDLQPGLMAKP
jgi:hypothetical protein